jgi:glutaminase
VECQTIIDKVYRKVKEEENVGAVASYIPELQEVDPEKFGVHLTSIKGEEFATGDYKEQFSIQSIAKVFSLCMAIEIKGKKLWQRVDVEPSGTAFNSLVHLEYESGIPRNPFINAGALVICDILISELDDPKKEFMEFIRQIASNPEVDYNQSVADSEQKEGYRNFALINFLRSFGNIGNDIEEVLDFYFNLCSIKMNCLELSETFLFLANGGVNPVSGKRIISKSNAKRVNALMSTCGFYDESGEFAYRVGLPGKSGVGGGIVAVYPKQYAIAVWSPRLNAQGNSHRGMKFLEFFTTETEDSIF